MTRKISKNRKLFSTSLVKHLMIFTFIAIILGNCVGQVNSTKLLINPDSIRSQAIKMTDFLIKRNSDSLIEYQYPGIIEMFGSKEKAIQGFKNSWKQYDADSLILLQIIVGEPSKIINYQGELQCTIPQSFEFRAVKGRVIVKSTLIAISQDNGKKWYFIDVVEKNRNKIKTIFPNLSSDLIIPEQDPPKIVKN